MKYKMFVDAHKSDQASERVHCFASESKLSMGWFSYLRSKNYLPESMTKNNYAYYK